MYSAAMPEHLFVYGTLRREIGSAMHDWLAARADLVGKATMPGRLYDLGAYPGVVPPRQPDDRVAGEVYLLPSDGAERILSVLDRYEGCGHPEAEYRRERRAVRLHDGHCLTAWVYLYDRPVGMLPHIASGDYAAYRQDGLSRW